MKNRTWLCGLAAVVLMGSTALSRAEDMGSDDKGAQPGMEDGMGRGPGGGMDRMKEKLGLSDAQAEKVKDLFKKNREEMKPLRDQEKIDMDTLQQKVDTKASDGEVKKLLDSLSADRDKLQANRKKMEEALKGILTPTQQAKMVLGMRQRGRGMMGKWGKKGMRHGGKNTGGKGQDGSKPAPSDGGGEAN